MKDSRVGVGTQERTTFAERKILNTGERRENITSSVPQIGQTWTRQLSEEVRKERN